MSGQPIPLNLLNSVHLPHPFHLSQVLNIAEKLLPYPRVTSVFIVDFESCVLTQCVVA